MYLFPFFTPRHFLHSTRFDVKNKSYKIKENKDNIIIEVDALGRDLSEIEVNLHAQKLHVELPKSSLLPENPQVQKVLWQELNLDAKSYKFNLGAQVDSSRTQATLENGKLLIKIYKKEEEIQVIPVQNV
jgi:HSP20 family molecular chaperone IbpA